MSRTSEYRKLTLSRTPEVGAQIGVTVESMFDGGFVALFKDSTGGEYRGALLHADKNQTFGKLPTLFTNPPQLANPLTVIHDHSYQHNIKESLRKLTQTVPSHVLLSWGSIPSMTSTHISRKVSEYGVASREEKTIPPDYTTRSARVYPPPPPPPPSQAADDELYVPVHSATTNSFSRAAKSSAIYKIGVSIRNQQRKRKATASSPRQRLNPATLLSITSTSPHNNSDDTRSINSDISTYSSSSDSYTMCSDNSSADSDGVSKRLKKFSLHVSKLEVKK